MFGYVLVDKPSLRIREYDYYRATYCGLCHTMGKCTGCVSRLTLSYDMTFFVLLRESIDGVKVEIEEKRCVRHPVKKRKTVSQNPQLEYCAYVGAILTSGKLEDDINDERGAKRLLVRMIKAFLSTMGGRSDKALPLIADFVSQRLAELSEIEKRKTVSIDEPADVFGELMAKILSYGFEGEKMLVAREIGKRIGRWIYIADALDDYESDAKSGSYNPFVLLYGGEQFSEDNIISISSMLEAELALALSALDLLDGDPDKNRSEIIRNILCLGMPASVKRILDKKQNGDN